eukprot:10403884-Lingulodinium_polyedra.AAC.1
MRRPRKFGQAVALGFSERCFNGIHILILHFVREASTPSRAEAAGVIKTGCSVWLSTPEAR